MASPRPVHSIGIYADPEADRQFLHTTPTQPFTVYVIGYELDGQVKGMEYSIDIPPGSFLLSLTWPGYVCVCWPELDEGEVIAGTGGCFNGNGAFRLGTASFLPMTNAIDYPMCVRGTDPSSFPDGSPGYLQCDGDKIALDPAPNRDAPAIGAGCLLLNPMRVIPTEEGSIGLLKSRY